MMDPVDPALIELDEAPPTSDPWEALETAPVGFLAGTAGSGKTTIARGWAKTHPEAVLCATTGIAAVNLGGATINSLLRYFNTTGLKEYWDGGGLATQLRKLRKCGIWWYLLDEASMLDGNALEYLVGGIRQVNETSTTFHPGDDPDDKTKRQAIRLTLIGDLGQLSPVEAPYCFETSDPYRSRHDVTSTLPKWSPKIQRYPSEVWPPFEEHTVVLSHIHRQDDVDFLQALQHVRQGEAAQALEYFRPLLKMETHDNFDGTTIYATNTAVANYNERRLNRMLTPWIHSAAHHWGQQLLSWHNPKEPRKQLIPDVLKLREGCLVMILANAWDNTTTPPTPIYVNGDLATVRELHVGTLLGHAGSCYVTLHRTGQTVLVARVTLFLTRPLEPGERKQLRLAKEEHLITENGQRILGTVNHLPLRVAYGSTCHKAQGLTLDTVQINFIDHFWSTPGMAYVALSRCRTVEGLRLVGSPKTFAARCVANEAVRRWL